MVDYQKVRERVEQFDMAHGNEPIKVGAYLLFSDGAFRDVNSLGPMWEPPEDLAERAKRIIQYQEERLRRSIDAFDRLKQQFRDQVKAQMPARGRVGPPPRPEQQASAIQQLKKLKRAVQDAQEALDDARRMLAQNRPERQLQREQEDAERRAAHEKFLNVVNEIEI